MPTGQRSSPLKPKIPIYDRQSILSILVVLGLILTIFGASICSLSGIIFRPEVIERPKEPDYEDYEDYELYQVAMDSYYDKMEFYHNEVDERDNKIEEKNQKASFIFMIGATFLLIGLLLFILMFGLVVVSSTFPLGLRVTAGILLVMLIPFFLTIFIMSGPARLLVNMGGI